MTCDICGAPLDENAQTLDFAGRRVSLCAQDGAATLAVLVANVPVETQRELYEVFVRWRGAEEPGDWPADTDGP